MSYQRVGFHLTDRCQLDCQHCLRDPAQKPADLSLDLIATVLEQAVRVYAIRNVSLTGGEPTLHPEFNAVIDTIAAHGCAWDMVTNGRRFPSVLAALEAVPARRAALRSLSLSLDGADEAAHDAIRGKGSYREVLGAASLCAARGIRFGIQMAVHARNAGQIEAVGVLAAQLGAAHVSFAMTQPTGTLHDEALFLPARAWRPVQDRIERLTTILKIPVVMPDGYPTEQAFNLCAPFRGETLHVDVQGRLTLCCQHSGVPSDGRREDTAGDLREVSLPAAHRKILGIVHDALTEKLSVMEERALDEWEKFPCNHCLAMFGKPHWRADGASGPAAARARWQGAWSHDAQRAEPPLRRGQLRVIG